MSVQEQKRLSLLCQDNLNFRRIYDTDKIEKYFNLIKSGKDSKQLFERLNDDDKKLYEILTKNAVDFNNDQDCEHPELIQKEKSYQKFLNEIKLEFFPKNHVLFKIGQSGDTYYIVLKGAAQCLIVNPNNIQIQNDEKKASTQENDPKKNNDDNEMLNAEFQSDEQQSQFVQTNFPNLICVKTFQPGESFGEIALMTSSKRTATIICSEDTYLINLTKQGFEEIMGAYKKQLMEENIKFLEQFPFFSRIATPKLLGIWHYFKHINANKKSIIYNLNEPSKYIYFVRRGEVEINKQQQINENQVQEQIESIKQNRQNNLLLLNIHNKDVKANFKWVPIVIVGPNQFFGQHEIVNKKKKRDTQAVVSCMDTEILQIEKSKLIGILRYHRCLDYFINAIKMKQYWQNDRIKESTSTIKITNEKIKPNDIRLKINKPKRSIFQRDQQSLSKVISEQSIPSYQLLKQRLEANFSIPSLTTLDNTDNDENSKQQQQDEDKLSKHSVVIPSLKEIASCQNMKEQTLFTIPDMEEKLQESDLKFQVRPKHKSDDGTQIVKQNLINNIQLKGQLALNEYQEMQKADQQNQPGQQNKNKLSTFISELQSNYIIGGTSKQYNKKLFGNILGNIDNNQNKDKEKEKKRYSLQVTSFQSFNKTLSKLDYVGSNLQSKRFSEMPSLDNSNCNNNNIFLVNNINRIKLQPLPNRKQSNEWSFQQQENNQLNILSTKNIISPKIQQVPIQDNRKPMQVSNK